MATIGVLFGMENFFPGALVERINAMGVPGVTAEFVQIGGVKMEGSCPYRVVIDRISHDIPFYRAWLKVAALGGAYVVSNPFWSSADDKFFNYALAVRLGVAVPPTVLLPHKEHPPGTTDKSMRNLRYPLNWDEVFEYVGFPAFLKPFDGGGWRDVFQVQSRDEFFASYDQTRTLCMTLQRGVNFTEYFRCYVVDQREVHVMSYDPRAPFHERYVKSPPAYPPGLIERVTKDALTLCRALGYDLNTVEFAVEDGVPYAIDFMNAAPDADPHSVGPENFEWIVDAVSRMAVKKAQEPPVLPDLRWAPMLKGRP